MQPEDIREQMVPITVNTLYGQDLLVSDQDLTLTIDRFGERYIEPAAEIIANMIDGDGCDQYVNVFNFTGTPGVVPTTLDTYAQAGVVLHDAAVPNTNMKALVITPKAESKALGFQNNLFNPQRDVSLQYQTGKMSGGGPILGFKWSMDQNIGRQLIGTLGTSNPTMSATANQTGTSIATTGWQASTTVLNVGDVFSIVGVDAVNPISFRDTGSLRTFVVTAPVTSASDTTATINFQPPINADTTSPFQTVTALPGASAAILVYNQAYASSGIANISALTSAQMLAFHRDAFTFVCVDLELPGGLDWSERVSHPRLNVSMRLTRGFDIKENRRYTRLDLLGGWKTTRPEMACRIAGS